MRARACAQSRNQSRAGARLRRRGAPGFWQPHASAPRFDLISAAACDCEEEAKGRGEAIAALQRKVGARARGPGRRRERADRRRERADRHREATERAIEKAQLEQAATAAESTSECLEGRCGEAGGTESAQLGSAHTGDLERVTRAIVERPNLQNGLSYIRDCYTYKERWLLVPLLSRLVDVDT